MTERTSRHHAWTATATAVMAAALVLGAGQRAWSQPVAATQPGPPGIERLPEGTLTIGQIQLRLDAPVGPLTMDNVLLTKALTKLEGGPDRWLFLPGRTLGFLPYDDETPVTLRVPADKNLKVRQVIDSLLEPLSLTYRIYESDHRHAAVLIEPRPELERIGRPATMDELELLYRLRQMRISTWDKPLAEQLTAAMNRPINILFDITGLADPVGAYKKFNESLAGMAPNSVAGLLDQACLGKDRTWRVDGNTIVITDKIRQVLHQLARRVSVRWSEIPLEQALRQICQSAGVDATFQPGMIEAVEGGDRRVTWQSPDEKILNIIETLSGRTGITYEVRNDSIYFIGPRRLDPVIGEVTVGSRTGNYSYQFFLHKSMLSAEAQAAADQRIKLAVDAMNYELTGAGANNPPVRPTTQHE